MGIDVTDLRSFYGSPLGRVAARLVGRAVDNFWGQTAGLRVLGLGYATPYLAPVRAGAERTLAFMPASQGVVNWPASGPSASALVDPMMMPLPDASIDRVLLVHALEIRREPDRAAARGLAHPDAGRAHHRRGAEPAGLVGARRHHALRPWPALQPLAAQPPHARDAVLAGGLGRDPLRAAVPQPASCCARAVAWERVGIGFSLPFAGLHVVEATKQLYRPGHGAPDPPGVAVSRPVLIPAPASRTTVERRSGAP